MEYAFDVLEGVIPACTYVIAACRRHLDDLERAKDPHYAYRFDEGKANRICWFISKLPHTKGQWAKPIRGVRQCVTLEPWQCFILCVLFGWVYKSDGLRRFRNAYVEVPRKNGKSLLAAGIGLYMFVADGEIGAEVYSGATKEKQAMEVFKPARRIAQLLPMFRKKFGIEINKKSLTTADESKFEPLVRNPGDGSSPSAAIVDEYHEHDTATLHDAMDTGMGARDQPLLFVITTAGSNIGGPCFMLRTDVIKVLEGFAPNDQQFGIIYTLDRDQEGNLEDWKTEEAVRKANPNFGVSLNVKYAIGQRDKAINFANKQNIILTKQYNIWVNAASPWMNMEKWASCADPTLNIRDFAKAQCWHGADLGARIDLASRALLFKRREGDGEDHYYYFGYHYVPLDLAQDGEHQNYEQWIHDKRLIGVPGAEIKLRRVLQDIREAAGMYEMMTLAFDPWNALLMQQDLQDEFGEDLVITVPQTAQYMSEPMKEVQAAVYSGRFHHTGDPVATWAMSNVQVRSGNEEILPRKGKDDKLKIDPVSALVIAMNRAYSAPAPVKKQYRALVL
jgi:phage terminase large subunit-like protein